MQVCQHQRFECIQVTYRGINKCITNFNRVTTVAHVIDALLDDLSEKQYFTTNDCCLYVERPPYLFPLKSTEFIQDILLRYASIHIHFKLSFKRNSSPSRYAQRKKLLRTPLQPPPPPPLTNAYEQLQIQESLIRRQHEIITKLRETTVSKNYSSSNYDKYFDWITRQDEDHVDSDDSRTSSNIIPVCRRQSRQEEYQKAVNNRDTTNSSRSLSRVRFRTPTVANTHDLPCSSAAQVKSILKKVSSDYAVLPRTSSVDRDNARLNTTALCKQQRRRRRRNSVYTSDDADDDNLSDRSTTDSCLGSLSSDDNNSYTVNQHHLETLV